MKKTKLLGVIFVASTLGLACVNPKGASQSEEVKAVDINDYSACQTAYNNKSGSSMITALRNITSPGTSGTYDDLWTTYINVFVKSDGYIFDYYSSSSKFRPGTDQAGSYSEEGDVYNREHSIPKSWWNQSGTPAKGTQGTDPFFVVPTDGYVNNRRSNYALGMVSSATYTSDNGFSKLGSAVSSWGYSGTVFEPNDSVKGDLARMHFYVIAKYSDSYSWTNGYGSSTFSGSSSTNYGLTEYAVKLFSYWSKLDPVSEWEQSVNNGLADIQGNRNPFIDHPEYADTLWGSVDGYTKYADDSTPTASLSISPTSGSIDVGNTLNLAATASGGTGNVTWTVTSGSSNVSLNTTTGNNVTVTGVAAGSATVQASYSGLTATATITVTQAAVPTVNSVTVSPKNLTLNIVNGSASDTITPTVSVSGGAAQTVNWSVTPSGKGVTVSNGTVTAASNATLGTYTVTATSTVDNTKSDYCTVSVVSESQEVTPSDVNLSGGTYSDSDKTITWKTEDNHTTVTQMQTGGTAVNQSYISVPRVYRGNTLCFEADSGYKLSSIEITYDTTYTGNSMTAGIVLSGSAVTDNSSVVARTWATTSGGTHVVSSVSSEGLQTIYIQNVASGSNVQLRPKSITVYYVGSGGSSEELTSITASVSKTYYVGQTITKSDITVEGNNGDIITDFDFEDNNHMFTYDEATSGGALTNVVFEDSISYQSFTCSLTVQVQRKEYGIGSTTDLEHTGAEFETAGIASGTSSSYEENQTATVDGVTFNVSGYVYNNTYLSFSTSKSNAPGSVVSTTPYPSGITNVTVNGASPDIQLSTDGDTWVDFANATTSTTNYCYLKVYFKNTSQSSYINISSISVTLKASETAENVSNYIMYEDTNNQCVSKLSVAMTYFGNLSSSGKSTFASSDDYVIKSARKRLEAWAANQGKTINYSTGELTNKAGVVQYGVGQENSSTTIIIIVSAMSIVSLSVLLIIKKKRLHN